MTEHRTSSDGFSNRLIREKSPYLLQHAHNPVDWYPWGDEAFGAARTLNRPVFLSVGYSTCHWCHVMAHESFEDDDVARLMNEAFVCIKVDREERPDIDKVYMAVCQMLTGSGGWPLTVIMTPEREPFFAATYLPKESRYGRMGMTALIPRIQEIWTTRREDVRSSTREIRRLLHQTEKPSAAADSRQLPAAAFEELAAHFDDRHGGFGSAPKFPIPHQLIFLLRHWQATRESRALEMVEKTLQAMQMGGICDHIGHGFHRYATDENWLLPHFEKMLYDQAMLAMAYTEAFQATGAAAFEKTARDIVTYVIRDLQSPEGAFHTAEDADSEGVEGKFYLWTTDEINRLLQPGEAALVIRAYNMAAEGNYPDEATDRKTGMNIPHLTSTVSELARSLSMPEDRLARKLETARKKLFAARRQRVHPHQDDKILTDWNGLMIAALAQGYRVFGDPACLGAAQSAIDFIVKKMRLKSGNLLHCRREGQEDIAANLDDYAFFIWGLINCYEACFDESRLRLALELQDVCSRHFCDPDAGGYYFTPDDGEPLLVRQQEIYDGAIPSGNAVTMVNLIRLARITGNPELEAKAMRLGQAFSGDMAGTPSAYTQFMIAFLLLERPSREIVIAGRPGEKDTEAMLDVLRKSYQPGLSVLFRSTEEASPAITAMAPFTEPMTAVGDRATAYMCSGNACQRPTTDPLSVLAWLREEQVRPSQ